MESLFNVGDEVICVDSSRDPKGFILPLVEGKKYLIHAQRMPCCKSKTISVDVGVNNPYGTQECSRCHTEQIHNHWWFPQERFVKADTNQQLENEIFEAMKGEKVIPNLN